MIAEVFGTHWQLNLTIVKQHLENCSWPQGFVYLESCAASCLAFVLRISWVETPKTHTHTHCEFCLFIAAKYLNTGLFRRTICQSWSRARQALLSRMSRMLFAISRWLSMGGYEIATSRDYNRNEINAEQHKSDYSECLLHALAFQLILLFLYYSWRTQFLCLRKHTEWTVMWGFSTGWCYRL